MARSTPITQDMIEDFASAHPRPNTWPDANMSNTDWDNDCALFMYRVGQSYVTGWAPKTTGPTAYDVYKASKILGTDPKDAYVNAIHWFALKSGSMAGYSAPRPGHVGFAVNGGDTFDSATTAKAGSPISGVAHLRKMTVIQYLKAMPNEKYLGWSMDYAGARYVADNFAGGGVTPLPPDPEEVEMPEYGFFSYTGSKGQEWLFTHPTLLPGGILITYDQQEALAIKRVLCITDASTVLSGDTWQPTLDAAAKVFAQSQAALKQLLPASGSTPPATAFSLALSGKVDSVPGDLTLTGTATPGVAKPASATPQKGSA